MNYLAHAYLSFHDPDTLLGNMVADFVRGKQIYDFREEVQRGIRLHRLIDEFTDHHPVVRETKMLFDDSAGRYNSSFLDVAFDHFLALDSENEPAEGWMDFTEWCYSIVSKRINEMPDDFKKFFSHMKKENWLYNYRHEWMIEKTFNRLAERAKYLSDDTHVFPDFEENYKSLKTAYDEFFPALKDFTTGILTREPERLID